MPETLLMFEDFVSSLPAQLLATRFYRGTGLFVLNRICLTVKCRFDINYLTSRVSPP